MKVDMSPEAIAGRLRLTGSITALCVSLGGERLRARMERKVLGESMDGMDGMDSMDKMDGRWGGPRGTG